MQTKQKIYWVFSISLLIAFLLDFVTKRWALSESFREMVFIENFFYLTSVQKNTGIAFGIDLPLFIQIVGSFIILFLLLLVGFDCLFKQEKAPLFKTVLLGVVVGSAFGNLMDRVMNGYVIDFMVIRPFPVLNVADVGITVGLVVLFATMWLSSRKSKT